MGARYILALVLMVIVIIGWQVASHYMIKNNTVPELDETPTTQEVPHSTRSRRNTN